MALKEKESGEFCFWTSLLLVLRFYKKILFRELSKIVTLWRYTESIL